MPLPRRPCRNVPARRPTGGPRFDRARVPSSVDHDERGNAVNADIAAGARASWSMSIVLIGYPFPINCSTAGRILLARAAPFGVEVEQDRARSSRSRRCWWRSRERAIRRRWSCRKDSFPSGLAAGRRRDDVAAGLDQLGVARPVVRRATIRWLGLWPRGGVPDRRHLREPGPWPARESVDGPRPPKRTFSPKEADVARDDGRRAGDRLVPDPSLGGAPRAEGPTTHLLACRVPPFDPSTRSAGRKLRHSTSTGHGPTTVPRRRRTPSWPLTRPQLRSRVCEIPRGSRSPR